MAFTVMHFSQADENQNAWLYGVSPGLVDFGFNPVRGDDSLRSGQILDKVIQQVDRARLVVVKVDDPNLNVYFELGLAFGRNKDTLLVCSESMALKIPSDLRNWECVTYPTGSYKVLRARVHAFCEQNFAPFVDAEK